MGAAACSLRKVLAVSELGVKGVALLLRALVLPVRRPLVREGLFELFDKRLGVIEAGEDGFGVGAPEDGAVLLAGARDTLDAAHGCRHGLGETV